MSEGAIMPQDARKTWQYFAQCATQEEDPEKLSYLIQQLYEALDQNDEPPNPKIVRFRNLPSL
jgi:hypothetical protein